MKKVLVKVANYLKGTFINDVKQQGGREPHFCDSRDKGVGITAFLHDGGGRDDRSIFRHFTCLTSFMNTP